MLLWRVVLFWLLRMLLIIFFLPAESCWIESLNGLIEMLLFLIEHSLMEKVLLLDVLLTIMIGLFNTWNVELTYVCIYCVCVIRDFKLILLIADIFITRWWGLTGKSLCSYCFVIIIITTILHSSEIRHYHPYLSYLITNNLSYLINK